MIFYLVLFVGVFTTLLSIDSSLERPFRPLNLVPLELSTISYSKTVDIDKKIIFDSFANLENYPRILPNNVLLVNSILETESIYDVTLNEQGIKTTLKVEHVIDPYNKQVIKIIDGDAQGTTISQTFESIGNATKISIDIDLKTRGVLTPFSFLPLQNIDHAIDTIITTFVDYSKRPYNPNEKIVDDLYREILLRPADSLGLIHFSDLLDTKQITIEEISNNLLNSEEYQSKFLFSDLIKISDLKEETKNSIDELYNVLLRRNADDVGLEFFGSALENNKMTLSEIIIELLISDEFNSLPVETREKNETYGSNESWQLVNQTYYESHGTYAKKKIVRSYGIFLERGDLTLEEIEELFRK